MPLDPGAHPRPQCRCERVQVDPAGKMEEIHQAICAVFDVLLLHGVADYSDLRSMTGVYSLPSAW